MTITHCRPTGSLAANEISAAVPINDSSVRAYIPSGPKRGVVVSMHGLSIATVNVPPDLVTADNPDIPFGGIFSDYTHSFYQSVMADGWIVLALVYPEDYCNQTGHKAIYDSMVSDPGHGSLYVQNTTMLWWDHVVRYIRKRFGANIPIVASGASWGGWHTAQIAINRTNTLVGFCAQLLPCILSNANQAFLNTVKYYNIDCSGVYIPVNAFDGVNIPGYIGYGTNDFAIGYASTVVGGSSVGANVSSFTGSQSLEVGSISQMVVGPSVQVTTSTGKATITFNGASTNFAGFHFLNNCKLLAGSGTIPSGAKVVQNNILDLIAAQHAAQPGNPIFAHPGPGAHAVTSAEAAGASSWITSVISPLCPAIF